MDANNNGLVEVVDTSVVYANVPDTPRSANNDAPVAVHDNFEFVALPAANEKEDSTDSDVMSDSDDSVSINRTPTPSPSPNAKKQNLVSVKQVKKADTKKAFAVIKFAGIWRAKSRKRALNKAFSETDIAVADSCHSMTWTKTKIVPLKNYHSETRAMKDIEYFLDNPVVIFNPASPEWSGIAHAMVTALCKAYPEMRINKKTALRSIVDSEGDSVMLEKMQGVGMSEEDFPETDQNFVTVLSSTNAVPETVLAFCVFNPKINLGYNMEEVRILCLILSPRKEKQTKSAVEVGRTYSTLLADRTLQRDLQKTTTAKEFAAVIRDECARVHTEHRENNKKKLEDEAAAVARLSKEPVTKKDKVVTYLKGLIPPGKDLAADVKKRLKHYRSDFTDGLSSWATIQKIISATLFLYFSLLLPGLALGVLNDDNTHGKIDARKLILSQGFGGLVFSLFAGQPLGIVRTTIPVVLFTKVIYNFADVFAVDFLTFYFLTGIFNCFFMAVYSLTGVSKIMAYCSRSTEEIVGIFISIAFIVDSFKYIAKEFNAYYCFPYDGVDCDVAIPLASFILVFGTLFIGLQIYNFQYSQYLSTGKRELVAEYALAVSVLLMSFVGSYALSGIELGTFEDNAEIKTPFNFEEFKFSAYNYTDHGEVIEVNGLSVGSVLVSLGLGFIVSILFFVEGNVAQSMVNSPHNRLKKGSAYHLDLMVVAVINVVMSVFGLPWVHPALPHSPLHVKALAECEEVNANGVIKNVVVSVVETRLTNLISSILLFLSLLMIPYPLQYIPTPVLYGLLLFLAISSLEEFQLWERILLLVTEQNQYPPHHYVRKVPQKVVHTFTALQLLQLAVLCGLSFSGVSYLKMFFPFVIIGLMPVRKLLIPKIIRESHLRVLDGSH